MTPSLKHTGTLKHTGSPKLSDSPPIITVDDARERVRDLIGHAIRRQLWVMLLDADGWQLPTLIPVDGLPLLPENETITRLVAAINGALSTEAPGGSVILTLERPGPAALTAPDQSWGTCLRSSFGTVVPVTGIFLAHDEGVSDLAA
jgi:hypothetical protein